MLYFVINTIRPNIQFQRYLRDHDNYLRMAADREREEQPKTFRKRTRRNSGCLWFSSSSSSSAGLGTGIGGVKSRRDSEMYDRPNWYWLMSSYAITYCTFYYISNENDKIMGPMMYNFCNNFLTKRFKASSTCLYFSTQFYLLYMTLTWCSSHSWIL